MKKNTFKGSMLLLITAIIWGSAFVFQRKGMEYIGSFTFTTFRTLITFIILSILSCFSKVIFKDKYASSKVTKKQMIIFALFTGLVLFGAYTFQQFGLKYTTASKASFITSTQVVIVPIIAVIFRHKLDIKIWISVVLALIGFYLMSIKGSFIPSLGDSLTFMGAIFFSIQVLIFDKISGHVDPFKYGAIYNGIICLFSGICMFIFETPTSDNIISAIVPLLYVGLVSGVITMFFQLYGQEHTTPTVSVLILSLQSIFGLIFGMLVLKETISLQEGIGCAIVFVAVMLSQINFKINKKKISS